MLSKGLLLLSAIALASLATQSATGEERDYTCFQSASGYIPELDIGSDVAVVYGVNASFPDRVAGWRDKGYTASMMTGISWGGYDAYYGSGDAFKREEVQTDKNGKLFMHGHSTTVGYNVPTPAYVDYIKRYVDPAIDEGVQAIYLEEPEYWANTGWSEAFKKEWERFYGEPWQPPDSSPDAQYRASKLKYELYFNALKQVFEHIDARAKEKGIDIECHVPTHSLINYAHWRIVSPESHLIDIPQLDGYVAQVWTGTARTPNIFRGVAKERTFETAFFEYGQMLAMVRSTGRKVWFLADPIEDNPNRSWSDYKRNYECTIIASLMWPEVHRFEVMPWPSRIFKGTYPKTDMDSKSGDREGIPADYATQILIIINALNEMNQSAVEYETGTRGIGIAVSDTMMFQRADPSPSCGAMGGFYGLSLPLLKAGIPAEVVQLENVLHPDCLSTCDVLLLTYEHQKPLNPAYHDALADWVRGGGCLIYWGDGSDPYHQVREWWNDQGKSNGRADEDLFKRIGVNDAAYERPQPVGEGYVRVVPEAPSSIQQLTDGPERVRAAMAQMLERLGRKPAVQNYLVVRRGPFVVASVLDESVSDEPLCLSGAFVDLFDHSLPVVRERTLQPGERTLLYDLKWAEKNEVRAKVVAAGARITGEQLSDGAFSFVTRGPSGTNATARVLLPSRPTAVTVTPEVDVENDWDAASSTLWLAFPNQACDVRFTARI
jgi:hypothetical protein